MVTSWMICKAKNWERRGKLWETVGKGATYETDAEEYGHGGQECKPDGVSVEKPFLQERLWIGGRVRMGQGVRVMVTY
jgi:hypothetical protein